MKTCIVVILLLTASLAAASDQMERYVPNGTTNSESVTMQPQQVPQPQNLQSQQKMSHPQSVVNAPVEFKKFNISNKKSDKKYNHKKKNNHKKRHTEKKVISAAIPENKTIIANNIEPPRFIDIQAILARGKVIQVEEKKELNHAEQVEKSTQKPDGAIKDMAKTVYTNIPGSIYTMWCKKGFVTDIQLQTGESITAVNGGDTTRWLVEQTVSGGNGVPETQHVLVKPLQEDIQTNVIISTDKRIYQIKAISTENTYSPIISWTYPADDKNTLLFIQKQAAKEKAEVTTEEPVAPEALYFEYKIKSNSGMFAKEYPWTPLKAFNDGTKTYIQVNPQMKNTESPSLFVKDRDGKVNLVNYRLKNNYFIVDRLFETAELRNGTDEIVTITKENK